MAKHKPPQTPDRASVLLVGGGGREHALGWKLSQSPRLETLYITHPQNPGLNALGRPTGIPTGELKPHRLRQFCEDKKIDLVVIGPEDPLAEGFADELRRAGIVVFGPNADGAQLEADKAHAKEIMRAASIPTAEARTYTEFRDAQEYLESREHPPVIKAAGLAKGKGVIVPETIEEAIEGARRVMIDREFGDAGKTVIIEERLKGPEASILCITDGKSIYILDACQDHKRLLEDDQGPNTGGMGAFCPSPLVTEELIVDVQRSTLLPLLDILRRQEIDFRGVIYAGLMLTHGGPKVLEFNVRFGDPECQPLMARMRCDLVDVLFKASTGQLDQASIEYDPRVACTIVLASRGYPEAPETGFEITGIEDAEAIDDVLVFHAGTKLDNEGVLRTSGGRVLNVTAMGDTLADARERALQACEKIRFEGMHYRRDIGSDTLVTS
ncbi:MAG: phosphoribosylamine--glycine ligase [Planctomycetota bacterium]|jgi:phosphoribosylamine--glycine ligase